MKINTCLKCTQELVNLNVVVPERIGEIEEQHIALVIYSLWWIRHNFPPFLKRSPVYCAHAFLHPLPHSVPIHLLQFPYVLLQLSIPFIFRSL